MIQTTRINNIEITVPRQGNGNNQRTLPPEMELITNTENTNMIFCGTKESGKTRCCLTILRDHLMTFNTKLIIFSPSLATDKNNRDILKEIIDEFGEDNIVIYKKFIQEDKSDAFLTELAEAEDTYREFNDPDYKYSTTIFYFDDLNASDIKSEDLALFAGNIRHFGATCLYSKQDWINFSTGVRKNCDIVCLWKDIDEDRLKLIYKEIQPGVSLKHFIKAYNYAVKDSMKNPDKRDFLYVNKRTKELRKNFNESINIKDI